MEGPFLIPTELDSLELRQLIGEADDLAYFNAVDRNREHLSQFGDTTAKKYPDLESVKKARLETAPDRLRYGIWHGSNFAGSVNLRSGGDTAEIGYWLDERFTGRGFAKLAVRALAAYAHQRHSVVEAYAHPENAASIGVLESVGFKPVASDNQQLKFELVAPNLEGLELLEDVTDRREAMNRVLTPLMALDVSKRIAEYRKILDEPDALDKLIEADDFGYLIKPWLEPKRDFKTNLEATLGLIRAMQLTYKERDVSGIIDLNEAKTTITPVQKQLIQTFTWKRGGDFGLNHVADDTMSAQAPISVSMVLSGYLAAKYECQGSEELLEVYNLIPLEEVVEILSSKEFMQAQLTMAYAPNGTYAQIPHFANIPQRTNQWDDAKQKRLESEDSGLFDENSDPFTPLDMALIHQLRKMEPEVLKSLITKFSIYFIFEKTAGGQIQLDPYFVKTLRASVQLSNKYKINEDGLIPTKGCPALVQRVELLPEDLTAEQIKSLTAGEDPIASYTGADSQAVLTIHKKPIQQLHDLHIETLKALL